MSTIKRTDIIGMQIAKMSDVSFVSENTLDNTCQVIFNSDSNWTKVPLTIGTMIYTEKKNSENGAGMFYEQRFSGSLPGKERTSQSNVFSMFDEPAIVKLDLQDGSSLIVGNVIHQKWVRIVTDLRSSQNEVIVSFARDAIYPAFELAE